MELLCPLCGEKLEKRERAFVCPNRHSFDIARQGYVHLLPVQKKHSLAPGDTREQVLSRRAFLEEGHYAPIADALINAAKKYGADGEILDVGCGEGYYCTRLSDALGLPLTGLDISKEAVRCAAAKYKGYTWLCATAAHIPVPEGSVGLLTSLFALTLPEEYKRVLKPGGLYFQVLAAEDHLLGLKSIIYDQLIHKEKDSVPNLPGFARLESIPIRFDFTVEGEQVQNLFSMTPHVFRIGKDGAERLRQTERLTDTASCVLNVFRRE
ncbi:MAG: methyltransferase domain-containing protein [Oscillospiraceae bacterium]|nr:methyltransferase domain-containing protein [Oscillospiraceae bacterium]